LVSLLPPVHIAIVTRGQVLPSLDELFTLRRRDFLDGKLASYMNLITGPSRSADIEYTLVTGVHGPGEVHMVLVG
jgi:L-lactate dehydrogenase complex protein LldG